MKVINPSEISGKIINLIDEANEFVIIISPYYKIQYWRKLLRKIQDAKTRNVAIVFFGREDEYKSTKEVQLIGFEPILIKNLHAKIYFNEKEAIISSMNLHESSDNDSLDIGLLTENEREYKEIMTFYNAFIKRHVNNQIKSTVTQEKTWIDELQDNLTGLLGNRLQIYRQGNNLIINGKSKYELFIADGRKNDLRICGILSQEEYEFVITEKKNAPSKYGTLEVYRGDVSFYNNVWGTLKNIKSKFIFTADQSEVPKIKEYITNFIKEIEELRKVVNDLKQLRTR